MFMIRHIHFQKKAIGNRIWAIEETSAKRFFTYSLSPVANSLNLRRKHVSRDNDFMRKA
jgi:hypothetical protein